MDACNDPETEEIVVMSSAQVGKSEIVNNNINNTLLQKKFAGGSNLSRDQFSC